mmetsp:Transcript_6613/g.16275  ORF Transcript_6613/g.16275 Transcript_6613/m.16275 type:complete len:211 (-) Transcript_6613:120-752(-)
MYDCANNLDGMPLLEGHLLFEEDGDFVVHVEPFHHGRRAALRKPYDREIQNMLASSVVSIVWSVCITVTRSVVKTLLEGLDSHIVVPNVWNLVVAIGCKGGKTCWSVDPSVLSWLAVVWPVARHPVVGGIQVVRNNQEEQHKQNHNDPQDGPREANPKVGFGALFVVHMLFTSSERGSVGTGLRTPTDHFRCEQTDSQKANSVHNDRLSR